jgi:hypothetical protein
MLSPWPLFCFASASLISSAPLFLTPYSLLLATMSVRSVVVLSLTFVRVMHMKNNGNNTLGVRVLQISNLLLRRKFYILFTALKMLIESMQGIYRWLCR